MATATEKLAIVQRKIDLLRHAIDSGAAAELKKKQLLTKNAELKAQVEAALAQLIQLETANGKPQIAVPKRAKVESAPAPLAVKTETAKAAPTKPVVDSAKQAEQKAKKEAKKQAKAGNKKPQPANNQEKPVNLSRVKLIVGKIVEVERHPDAEGLYVEKMECGDAEPRQVISGLVKHVPIDQMRNRKVCMIANLKPAKMRGITSYGMVLCAKSGPKGSEKVELIRVPDCAEPGDIITTDDFIGGNWAEPDNQMNPKKKIFETVQPDFQTTAELVATWKGKPLLIKGKEEATRGKFVSDSIKLGGIS